MKTNSLPPDLLKKEIEMQTQALRRIRFWIDICLIISSVGIILIYLGINPDPNNNYFLIPGVLLTMLGVGTAVVFGYGHRNGKINVEKMINILERELKDSNKKKKKKK